MVHSSSLLMLTFFFQGIVGLETEYGTLHIKVSALAFRGPYLEDSKSLFVKLVSFALIRREYHGFSNLSVVELQNYVIIDTYNDMSVCNICY